MDYNQLARMLRMQPSVDSAEQPIDLKRPIVFDKGGYDPHTELSITGTGQELGLPQKNAFYNVPSIYNGQINDPNTFAGMNEIRKNVMQTPNAYKAYKTPEQAVPDAIQRSKDIGNMRNDELRRAVLMKYMENM